MQIASSGSRARSEREASLSGQSLPGGGRSICSVGDLTDADIEAILGRARDLPAPGAGRADGFVTALLFQSSSLRTRTGFAVATQRLGGSVVDVSELRNDPTMSRSESFADTLRTVQGMVDLVVTRTVAPLSALCPDRRDPVINGGELGGEHPTQALIDLLAIEEEAGPVPDLRIGVCGDLGARAARSLLELLGRRQPQALVLMAPPSRDVPDGLLGPEILARTTKVQGLATEDLDVLYMVGLPRGGDGGRLDDDARAPYVLTPGALRSLPGHAVVLSPMPIVDEIAPDARGDTRLRFFPQSDRGVAVRMACLEWCLGRGPFDGSAQTRGHPIG